MLTIYYDGQCPLCKAEMCSLKSNDRSNLLILVDLHSTNFSRLYPHIDLVKAMQVLHGEYQGKILIGLDVTYRAWTLVGKGFWVAPLNWPIIKTLCHWVYLGVAKYRHPISNLVARIFKIKVNQCDSGVCFDKSKNTHYRS